MEAGRLAAVLLGIRNRNPSSQSKIENFKGRTSNLVRPFFEQFPRLPQAEVSCRELPPARQD